MQLQEHSEFQTAGQPSEGPEKDDGGSGSEEASMSNQIIELIAELKNDINKQFDKVDARFDKMDARFDKMDARFDARLENMNTRMDARLENMDTKLENMDARFGRVNDEFTAVRKEIANIEKNMSDKFGSLYKWALGILVVALVSTVAREWF